jgi:sigma-B regulation protein RsbU (phosphoserine phosphatase)
MPARPVAVVLSARPRPHNGCGVGTQPRRRFDAAPTPHNVRREETAVLTDSAAIDPSRLRLLYDLGCAFAGRARLEDLVELVLEKCREVLDAEAASVLLHDAERGELYFPYVAERDTETEEELHSLRFPADRGIAGAVLGSGRALKIDDAPGDARFYGGVDRRTGLVTRNLLCAPLRSRHGAIGVIQVLNHQGTGFSDGDLAFLDALGGSIAVALENAQMYRQLTAQVAALERAVHEHNELLALRRELDIARDIQQSIVPKTFPDRADLRMFADMIPAQEVGGDFYDFFFLDDDRIGLLVGDVSGKGVPAALFMAMTRTLLRSTALACSSPGDCLKRVNALLLPENTAEMFVTVFYGILDIASGRLEYANGGHNPPYLMRAGGRVEALPRTRGTVLGMLDGIEFASSTAMLARGDALVLFSDGITEAMDGGGALFGEAGLEEALAGCVDASPQEIVRRVLQEVERHAGEAAQSDDITALVVRR